MAHDRLRALYERDEDWARVVKVAERQLFLTEDPAARVPRALELGALIRDRWATTRRPSPIFERVLEMDPDNLDALHGAADALRQDRQTTSGWPSPTRSCSTETEPATPAADAARSPSCYENHLDDPARGFEWYRRAYLESARRRGPAAGRPGGRAPRPVRGADPDLRRRARAGHRAHRTARGVAEDRAHLRGEAAAIRRAPSRRLCEALPADPAGRELLPNLERLAERTSDWRGLLDVYTRVARARTEPASASSSCACAPSCARGT